MKKYVVTYIFKGEVEINAENEDEALDMFNRWSELELYENAAESEITRVIVEEM